MSYYGQAIECVSSIATHWNADGSVKNYLLDKRDARLVVDELVGAGLLRTDRGQLVCLSTASPDGDHHYLDEESECIYCGWHWEPPRWIHEATQLLAAWDEVWVALGKPGPLGSQKHVESLRAVHQMQKELDNHRRNVWPAYREES